MTRGYDSVDCDDRAVFRLPLSSSHCVDQIINNKSEVANVEYPKAYEKFSYGEVQPCLSPLHISLWIGLYALAFGA